MDDWWKRQEELDAMLDEAGLHAAEGFSSDDGTVGWIIDGERRIALSEKDGHAWLFAEVGIEGDEVYPEDALAEEAGIDVPAGHTLWWDDNAERAILARDLGHAVDPGLLRDAIPAFARLANAIEQQLVSIEDLCIEPSPPDGDLHERGSFRPPVS